MNDNASNSDLSGISLPRFLYLLFSILEANVYINRLEEWHYFYVTKS